MSEETGKRRNPNRVVLMLAGITVLAAAAGGYFVGRETAPTDDGEAA